MVGDEFYAHISQGTFCVRFLAPGWLLGVGIGRLKCLCVSSRLLERWTAMAEKFYDKNYTQQVASKIEDVGMLFFGTKLLVNPPKTSLHVVL